MLSAICYSCSLPSTGNTGESDIVPHSEEAHVRVQGHTEVGPSVRDGSEAGAGGTHLYGKRSEFHASGFWPAYVARAEGGHFWDVDGNEFIDYNLGAGPVMLGHAFGPVIEAVQSQLPLGQLYATSSPLELDLARLVIELVPCAEMVRFARTGGEACAVAVRIARSYSRKDKVLFCGYHGWHDWYISANLSDGDTLNEHLRPDIDPLGVPAGARRYLHPFEYNDIDSLKAVLDANRGEVACIILEPARTYQPENDYLHKSGTSPTSTAWC